MGSFSEVWEERASDWVRWARSRQLDHVFWELNLPALLELLPAPGRLTLDIACGEGRVSRELARRGHRVIGIDSSPSLLAAGQEAEAVGSASGEGTCELLLGDVSALPLEDGVADLAVAFMALMTVDDMQGAVREIARVLEPGGRLCISLLHPVETWANAGCESYYETVAFEKAIERDGAYMNFRDVHRPLSDYFAALEQAGFVVESLREPAPGEDYVARFPQAGAWRARPFLLHLRAVLGS